MAIVSSYYKIAEIQLLRETPSVSRYPTDNGKSPHLISVLESAISLQRNRSKVE